MKAPHYRLYIARRDHKLNQKEVAKKLGISKQSYYKKENGYVEFTIREAKLLTKLFDCSLDDLFGENVER